MTWVAITCPECGAPLPRVAIWRSVTCNSCGSLVMRTEALVKRKAFRQASSGLTARKFAVVFAGYLTPNAAADAFAITHTQEWLLAFEEELTKGGAAALNAAMKARFPSLGGEVAIDIGAQVATGEMKWG